MHELSVMSYLLETVEEQAHQHGATRVLAINLVIGERASVIDDSLLYYFDLLTPGTVAEGARLNTRRTRMCFYCPACDADYTRQGDNFECPRCGQVGQVRSDGSELQIESIEVET